MSSATTAGSSPKPRAHVDAFLGRTPAEGPTTWAEVKANIKSDFSEASGPGIATARAKGAAVVDQAVGVVQEQGAAAAKRFVVGKLFGRFGGGSPSGE